MAGSNHDALLKAAVMRETQAVSVFLDNHREEALQLISEEGTPRAAQLLEVTPGSLYGSASSRKIPLDTPFKRGETRHAPRQTKEHPTDQAVSTAYWHGRADALLDVLKLLVEAVPKEER